MGTENFGLRDHYLQEVTMVQPFHRRVLQKAGRSFEELLTDKRVWASFLGLIAALNQWLGWEVPLEVFVAVEVLVLALVVAWKNE